MSNIFKFSAATSMSVALGAPDLLTAVASLGWLIYALVAAARAFKDSWEGK